MDQPEKLDEKTADAIKACVRGYIDAWYQGDAEKGKKSLHPELVKRIVMTQSEDGKNYLDLMSASALADRWRSGDGKKTPEKLKNYDIIVLDIHGGIATARLETPAWVDYMHLAVFDGQWVIVNILWERKP